MFSSAPRRNPELLDPRKLLYYFTLRTTVDVSQGSYFFLLSAVAIKKLKWLLKQA